MISRSVELFIVKPGGVSSELTEHARTPPRPEQGAAPSEHRRGRRPPGTLSTAVELHVPQPSPGAVAPAVAEQGVPHASGWCSDRRGGAWMRGASRQSRYSRPTMRSSSSLRTDAGGMKSVRASDPLGLLLPGVGATGDGARPPPPDGDTYTAPDVSTPALIDELKAQLAAAVASEEYSKVAKLGAALSELQERASGAEDKDDTAADLMLAARRMRPQLKLRYGFDARAHRGTPKAFPVELVPKFVEVCGAPARIPHPSEKFVARKSAVRAFRSQPRQLMECVCCICVGSWESTRKRSHSCRVPRKVRRKSLQTRMLG